MQRGFSTSNNGIFLAVIAGVFSFAVNVWGGSSQYGDFGAIGWVFLTLAISAAYIIAAIVVDRNQWLSRGLLVTGALIQVGSAIYFGDLLDGGWVLP